jgi:hypothetical protein
MKKGSFLLRQMDDQAKGFDDQCAEHWPLPVIEGTVIRLEVARLPSGAVVLAAIIVWPRS